MRRSRYEEFWALKGVSLHLDPGDTVGLIGENGSGKSTLLKCIAGILEPTKGEIRTHGPRRCSSSGPGSTVTSPVARTST